MSSVDRIEHLTWEDAVTPIDNASADVHVPIPPVLVTPLNHEVCHDNNNLSDDEQSFVSLNHSLPSHSRPQRVRKPPAHLKDYDLS